MKGIKRKLQEAASKFRKNEPNTHFGMCTRVNAMARYILGKGATEVGTITNYFGTIDVYELNR